MARSLVTALTAVLLNLTPPPTAYAQARSPCFADPDSRAQPHL